MDPNRFDHLSKAFARRLTRRGIIGGLAAGGVAAVVAEPSLAADGKKTCVYEFDGTIDVGPSSTIAQTNVIAGELTITIGPDGAIDSGKLVGANGGSWSVVGQATGRAVSLRISVPNTGAFIAVGTGRKAIAGCTSEMDGPASGPLRKDAGSWKAVLKKNGATPTPVATAAVGGAQPTAAPTEAATDQPTAEPTTSTCTLTCDGKTLGLDPNSCACLCPAGQTFCVEIATEHAVGGRFLLAPETALGTCVDTTSDKANCGACNQHCDAQNASSATCVNSVCTYECQSGFATCDPQAPCAADLSSDPHNCNACGSVCEPDDASVQTPVCEGGFCKNQCTDARYVTCSADALCKTDLTSDSLHCGACDTPCSTGGQVCQGSVCINQCLPGLTTCPGAPVCSTSLDSDALNCGYCGNICSGNTPICSGSNCQRSS